MITKESGELLFNENLHERTGRFSSYPHFNSDKTADVANVCFVDILSIINPQLLWCKSARGDGGVQLSDQMYMNHSSARGTAIVVFLVFLY